MQKISGLYSRVLSNQNILQMFLWLCWLLLLLIVSYKSRYWINNDTIGSLDSSNYIKNGNIVVALNAYWGLGYAIILSLLPFHNISSWLNLHLVIAFLIIASQLFIYKTLRLLNVHKIFATLIVIVWGAGNFTTGSAFFLTADVPLCFWGSFYLWWAIKSTLSERIYYPLHAGFLGFLHGIAYLTKMMALFALSIVPLSLFVFLLTTKNQSFRIKNNLNISITFLLSYCIPLVIIVLLFLSASHLKYGRYTIGDTGAYAYTLLTEKSKHLHTAQEESRHKLPLWGTYWWSDISINLEKWDKKMHFNISDQVNRILENARFFISRQFLEAIVLFTLIALGLLFVKHSKFVFHSNIIIFFNLCSIFILILYFLSNFCSRFFPFAALFSLPAFAISAERFFQKQQFWMSFYAVLLTLGLLHGIGGMAFAAYKFAPNAVHFDIVREIKSKSLSNEFSQPIGAFFAKSTWYHHGIIAFILNTCAAEIYRESNYLYQFNANFDPGFILLIANKSDSDPSEINVNTKVFKKIGSWDLKKGQDFDKIIVYKKEQLTRN